MESINKSFNIPLSTLLEKDKIVKSLKKSLDDKKLAIIKRSCPNKPCYLILGWRYTILPYSKIIKIFFKFVSMISDVVSKENDKFRITFTIKRPDIPLVYDPEEDKDINEQDFYDYLKKNKITTIPGKTCTIRVSIYYDCNNDKYIIETNRLIGDSKLFFDEIKKLWVLIEEAEKLLA